MALTRYGTLAASTRQRFQLYEGALAAAGIDLTVSPLLGNDHMERLVAGKPISALGVGKGYARRAASLLRGGRYDLLWLHCESFPYLPGPLERLAFAVGRPVVYDFDDAIFHIYDEAPNPLVRRLLGGKLEGLIRGAAACTCGNPYLQDYAASLNPKAMLLPTVVDTDRWRPVAEPPASPPVIGWIGSPSTWCNVQPLLPLLRRLHRDTGVRIRAVGAGAAAAADGFDGLELVDWSEEREIAEVQGFTIGIMPLLDLPFQRGKSGFKLIQYMACGLPVMASPVGVNASIVQDGVNGLLASSEDEWEQGLRRLIADSGQRASFGAEGRRSSVADFSLAAHAPRLVSLFREVGGRPS